MQLEALHSSSKLIMPKEKPPADIPGGWFNFNLNLYRLIYRRELGASTRIVMSPSGKERKPKAK
jgi:hypothetical protein